MQLERRFLQAILAPARFLRTVLGKELYIRLYASLDSSIGGISEFSFKHGGAIFAAGSAASLAFGAACLQQAAAKLVKHA